MMRTILDTLLELTPAPTVQADPDEVLAALDRVLAARQQPLEALEAALQGGRALDPECSALLEELRARDARWMAAVVHARHELAARLAAMRRMRHRGG